MTNAELLSVSTRPDQFNERPFPIIEMSAFHLEFPFLITIVESVAAQRTRQSSQASNQQHKAGRLRYRAARHIDVEVGNAHFA